MRTWNGAVQPANAQFEAKRQAILREAASCFTRKGYHGTSLTEIADTLGVSKAALYTYVKSKDELLYFCHRAAMDGAIEIVERAQREGGSGLDRLCVALTEYLGSMLSDQNSHAIILEEQALLPEHATVILELRDRFETQLRNFVNDGIEDGSIVRCNPKVAVFSALGMFNWVMKWYTPGGTWNGEQIAEMLSSYLRRMLSTQPAATLAPHQPVTPPVTPPVQLPVELPQA